MDKIQQKYQPPAPPTMLEMLISLSGCKIVTNVNGGNAYGNQKNKKRKEYTFKNKQVKHRGPNITIGKKQKGKNGIP